MIPAPALALMTCWCAIVAATFGAAIRATFQLLDASSTTLRATTRKD